MEALEEPTHINKGKRTKRQRPQSPIPFSVATHNSSSGDGDGDGDEDGDGSNDMGENTNSSAGLVESMTTTTTEEEEEDLVANCLILLAQGGHSIDPSKSFEPKNCRDRDNDTQFKFTSKRFIQTPSTASGSKAGIYVYQCKTCDRTFPSFQALGGHRASHKKPKLAAVDVKRTMSLLSFDGIDEEGGGEQIKGQMSSPLSLQLSNSPNSQHPKSSPKVHECSVCGAEFASGQALGGHMRRHRVASHGSSTTLSLSPLSPMVCEYPEDQLAKNQRTNVVSLDLDLNLPATEDDQVGESKHTFAPKQPDQVGESKHNFAPKQHDQVGESKHAFAPNQQQKQEQHEQPQQQLPLVLSTGPSLVDCHY